MRGTIFGLAAVAALALAACGDPATDDARGYTKAPLEDPDVIIVGEEATAMAELGRPDRPRAEEMREEEAAARAGSRAEAESGSGGSGSGGSGSASEPAQQVSLAPGVTQEQFDQGKRLFGGQGGCMACHGPSAGGTQLGPNLTDDQWLHIPGPDVDALAGVITAGVSQPKEHPGPMPPLGGASLTEDQVRAIAGYLASLSQE